MYLGKQAWAPINLDTWFIPMMQCENVIYAYMGFAAFSIFFVIAGIVALQLLQMQTIPLDLVSFFFILWNFSVSTLDTSSPLSCNSAEQPPLKNC